MAKKACLLSGNYYSEFIFALVFLLHAYYANQRRKIMRFDDNKWVTNILKVVDTLNTLNGGMSSPSYKLNKNEDNYLLALKAPGISPEAMRVEVVEDKLMIYHLLDFGNEEQEIIPNIINVIPIPRKVDIKKVFAEYEEKLLLVHLPFGEKSNGQYRSVDIHVNH